MTDLFNVCGKYVYLTPRQINSVYHLRVVMLSKMFQTRLSHVLRTLFTTSITHTYPVFLLPAVGELPPFVKSPTILTRVPFLFNTKVTRLISLPRPPGVIPFPIPGVVLHENVCRRFYESSCAVVSPVVILELYQSHCFLVK